MTREVLFRPRNKRYDSLMNGELVFEFWNQEKTRGFWTLTDDEGFRWIVKYFATGQKYRVFIGVEFGYDAKGLAFPMKRKQGSETQELTTQTTVVDDSEESDDDPLDTGRTFRKRNVDQIRPYHTEMTNYKRSKDGKEKQDFKTEYEFDGGFHAARRSAKVQSYRSNNASGTPPAWQRSPGQSKTSSKPRLSSGSIENKVTPSPTPEPPSLENIQNNTTLYIFTNSDDAAPGTIYLRSCADINSFFSQMPRVAGVEEHDIRQITLRFDWLPESKPNTIRMIRGLPDSYDKMMEEIREAPGWKKNGDRRASVFVNVVLK